MKTSKRPHIMVGDWRTDGPTFLVCKLCGARLLVPYADFNGVFGDPPKMEDWKSRERFWPKEDQTDD